MRKRMPYNNNMRNNNNMNRGNHRNNNNNRRPMRGGFDEDEMIHPRQRKHAQNMKEKYINQARDARINGDRVQAEYWLQHAEHYARILNAIDEMFAPATHGGEEGSDMGNDSQHSQGGESEQSGSHGHHQQQHGHAHDENDEMGQPAPQPQQSRQPRQPRRPYQGQSSDAGEQSPQSGEAGQSQPRSRGQWRQTREPRPDVAANHTAPTHAEPTEDLGLPLAAVLPAARMDEDHQE